MKNDQKHENTTEFVDEEGKRWIQTSTEDLFSLKEFNDILEDIEKQKEEGEIVLAHIDFKKVNREYYETALELRQKLEKQTEILKKVITQSRDIIDRKNNKLTELIEYIRKLHFFIAHLKGDIDADLGAVDIPLQDIPDPTCAVETPQKESVYEEVEEIVVPTEGDIEAHLA